MAHTKPLFACPWLEVIASNLWHCTTHMTVVAFEVAVHIHRNAAFTNQCSFSPEEQPALLGSASSDEVVLRTFLLAIEGPNPFRKPQHFAAQIRGGNACERVLEHLQKPYHASSNNTCRSYGIVIKSESDA